MWTMIFAVVWTARAAPTEVPDALRVPDSAALMERHPASGVQIYACNEVAGSWTWTHLRPEATLVDADGHAVGHHGAGPTWSLDDGGSVVGRKLAQAEAPVADAVPWLLVEVVSSEGQGRLAGARFIQRVATKGGRAPTSGCGPDSAGKEVRIPYTADYVFFSSSRM
ncbi:MAG: DUF3455 domain-containing protein [Alphaproteobacteria bacterium]|nr:DUF3455 domain-containing protein [Alphaproteobacteria bacterium]MCB9696664.1 DUF3455 domain-containing protein [Alphaproteobacteria bacterium]